MKKIYPPLFAVIFSFSAHAQQHSAHPDFKQKRLAFTENKGQVADQFGKVRNDVRFTVAAGGVKIFIAENALHYQWQKNETVEGVKADAPKSESYRVDVNLLNAHSTPEVITEGPSDYYTNYYMAHCPQGITYVRNYNKITLRNIYRNIDWVFHINDESVEYDFLVHPGGNPADIVMQIEGATDLSISEKGSLVLTSPLGVCEQLAPVAYQNGKAVASKFVLKDNVLRLAVDDYNPTLALNIDPIIKIWGTYFGGTLMEKVSDLETDNFGNVYMAGITNSSANISSGGHQLIHAGGTDGLLVKFDAAGNRVWATYYGGAAEDIVAGCATDASGNVFISGTTGSETAIAFNGFKNSINSYPFNSFGTDAFLVKFNSSGVRQWGTYMGAAQASWYSGGTWDRTETYDEGYSCATDLNGNVYLAGVSSPLTLSNCWDSLANPLPCQNISIATPGAYQDTTSAPYTYGNGFLVKFDSNGNRLWGTYYGCDETNSPFTNHDPIHCATDRAGNVYLAGTTDEEYDGPSFGFNGHQNNPGSATTDTTDCWLVKFDPTGTTRLWGTYYGGRKSERLTGLCTDSAGNVFIQGSSTSPNTGNVIATPGTFRSGPMSAEENPFLAKFNSAGVRQWGTYMGDVGLQQSGGKCAADNSGNVVTTFRGEFISQNYGWVAYCGSTRTPEYGVAITRFNANGGRDWAEVYDSDTYNDLVACAVTPNGKSIYLADHYNSTNPNVPLNASQDSVMGWTDAYLICYRDTAVFDTICGHVFDDVNGNGVKDFGESFFANREVYMDVPEGLQSGFTDTAGYYEIILPRWGTSGLCNSDLVASLSGGKVVSIPLAGRYPNTILGNSPGCIYDFGLSPSITISGKVYYDTNQGGTLTSGEPGISIQSVSFNAQRQAYTDGNGDYFALIPVGTYNETFDKLDAYATSTSNPANYTINGTSPGSTFTSRNFGAYFTPSFIDSKVDVWSYGGIPPVVGMGASWTVRVTNVGTLPTSDTIVFYYDSLLIAGGGGTIDSVAHTVTLVTGTIVPARYFEYVFGFSVPPTVPIGTILHNRVCVSPTLQPDTNLANNCVDFYARVVASYDPNNKISETNTSDPVQHLAHNWSNGDDDIQYVINFQNTGTYTAFNVVINDTLSPNLDASTVEIIKTSHTCAVNRSDNTLNFKFSLINLPDSATNEVGSKGYIVFRVKAAAGALPGDSIVNRAAIYFDYNSAVLTDNNIIHLVSVGPCNSLVTKNMYDTVCVFYNYVFYGDTIHSAGTYVSDTFTTALGCDSIVKLHLAFRNSVTLIHKYATICNYNGYAFNGTTYYNSGIYYGDTIYPTDACAIDTVLHLTVNITGFTYYDTLRTCADARFVGPRVVTEPGIYMDTIVDFSGCVSIRTTIISRPVTGFVETICSGDSVFFAGEWRKDGGYYYNTLQSECRTDSVLQLILMVIQESYSGRQVYKCPDSTYNFYGNDISTPGFYSETLFGAGQCGYDSVDEIYLQDYQGTQYYPGWLVVYIDPDSSFSYHGTNYSQPGWNYATLYGEAVCGLDSMVPIYIVVNPVIDTTTTLYVTVDSLRRPQCAAGIPGYVHVRPIGGVGPYTYLWNIGDTTPYVSDMGGWYGVTCTDNNGLTASISLGSYYDTVLTTTPTRPLLCNSLDSASVIIQLNLYPHNTRYPYRLLFHRVTNLVIDTYYIYSPATSFTVPDLRAGYYLYQVSDSTGCTEQQSHVFQGRVAFVDTIGSFVQLSLADSSNCSSGDVQLIVGKQMVVFNGGGGYSYRTNLSLPPYYISYENDGIEYRDTLFLNYNLTTLHNLSPGTHSITVTDAHGCSKVLSVAISGLSVSLSDNPVTPCASQHLLSVIAGSGLAPYNFLWSTGETTDSIIINQPGTYSVEVNDAAGCSAARSVTVPPVVAINTNIAASICSNQSYNFNSNLISAPGIYSDTLVAASGCDSVVTLNLSVLSVSSHSLTASVCQGDAYNFNGQSYTQTGTYTAALTNSNGCDSTVTLSLSVLQNSGSSYSASVCANNSYSFHGQVLDQPGTYTAQLISANSCDSVVTLNLSVIPVSSSSLNASVCQGDAYNFNGQTYTQAGTYNAQLVSANGCDSMVTLNLSVLPVSSSSLNASVCQGDAYNFNGQSYTQAGTYNAQLVSANGCDSVVTLSLSVLPVSSSSLSASVCQGDAYNFNGQAYTQAGTYSATLTNNNGCDSTVTLSLSVLQNSASSLSASVCADSSYDFHGQVLDQTGTYTAQLISANGCDSVVTLHLTAITPSVPVITKTGDTLLSSNAAGYQWYLNNNPVPGATDNFLVITQNGQYHVAVTDSNGCSETSAALNVMGVGIASVDKDLFARVFPNPASQQIIIETNFIKPLVSIQTLQGQLINEFYAVKSATPIDITNLASAVYLVKIVSSRKTITLRFVKE